MWANLACTVLIVGPATVAGLRRVVRSRCARVTRLPRAPPTPPRPARRSPPLLALLVADLSGMSKAETERIWLPFAVWLLPACAFLTGVRGWLVAQAVLALLLNHLLLTGW